MLVSHDFELGAIQVLRNAMWGGGVSFQMLAQKVCGNRKNPIISHASNSKPMCEINLCQTVFFNLRLLGRKIVYYTRFIMNKERLLLVLLT